MEIHALFDEQGNFKTAYILGVNCSELPDGVIEITEDDWKKYIDNGGNKYRRGEDGKPQEKPPYTPTKEELLSVIRTERNRLLAEADWTDTLSAKTRLGEEKYNQWQEYRQALRDLPKTCDINNPVWPVKPE